MEDRFIAAVHGVDLDKELGNDIPQNIPSKTTQNNFIFGDPSEYEKLSDDERNAKTQKMMDLHKDWAGNLNINI